jgi:hypothetical protein
MKKERKVESWRHVYFYFCSLCTRKRATFNHERAALGICTRCEPEPVDPNQAKLL